MSRVTVNPVARARGPKKGGCVVSGLLSLGMLLFAASMVTVIVAVAIWPGEAKLTAPLLCPDDQPDAFVVADTTQVQPGETSTSFTLYCMGERGDTTDLGFAIPFALLTALHLVLIVLLLVVLGLIGGLRRRARGGAEPSPGPPEPQAAPGGPPPPGTAWADAADQTSSSSETDFEPPGPIIS